MGNTEQSQSRGPLEIFQNGAKWSCRLLRTAKRAAVDCVCLLRRTSVAEMVAPKIGVGRLSSRGHSTSKRRPGHARQNRNDALRSRSTGAFSWFNDIFDITKKNLITRRVTA